MEQSRRGFLTIIAGAMGLAFLPKKPTAKLHVVDAGTSAYLAQDDHPSFVSANQLSYLTRRSYLPDVYRELNDELSTLIDLRMEEAGNACRDMLANHLL
jgi:hypothetical protein